MSLGTYSANKLNDLINGVASYTTPTVYVALVTSASSPGSLGTEATYTGYARVALSGLMGSSSGGSSTNSSAITFGACTAGTNTIVGFAFMDAASGGNLLKYGTCALSVSAGITPQFATGALTSAMS